ncbi:MAG TPA: hypothetical protein VK742_20730 [Candidatus Sulfotelmatobacter sp.]|jgi:hypothetical protein|nr:hypothetical protein [Candidatus Sulfotelmatobacter sp.]
MKKLTTLILFSFLAAVGARADVIFQDQFNYTDNGINPSGAGAVITNSIIPAGQPGAGSGNSYWVRFSGTAAPSDMLISGDLLQVSTTGAGLLTPSRQDDCGRLFSQTNGCIYTNVQQVIYVSFIINMTNVPTANGAYISMMKNGAATSTFYQAKLWALAGSPSQTTNNFTALPNTYRLGVSASGSGSPSKVLGVDLALNTPYQVVIGWNPTAGASADGYLPYNDAVYLWVNPVSPTSDPVAASSDTFAPSASNIADDYGFRQATGFGGYFSVSNLLVTTTYWEAVTNVQPTNAVAPIFVYQPTAVISNFVNASFNLTAVANGQGLAAMTYQWQVAASTNLAGQPVSPVNVTSGDISGVNSNAIAFTSSQPGDSGYYTLIATTPYGLSVTSSVAKVSVTIAAVPPVFTVQPVSSTNYAGVASIVLTTTVTSPGTVSYTWYSNNVVVSSSSANNGQQNDSGTSSTYTINSPSAGVMTYKVAVTNNTTTTGIVSTNAVLTFLSPQSVSILYLRQLAASQDPVNFVPTDNTTPYSITGVITTYTNITSGNTASYYLQDATAGVNIFATFGSTFRPAQGDSVTFVGVLSFFTSGLEVDAGQANLPYTSYVDNGAGTLPTPLPITFAVTNTTAANLATNILGRYVTLSGVYFTNNGVYITNGITTVTNAAGQKFPLEFPGVALDPIGQVPPAYATTVTGVMFGTQTNVALCVTKFSDIVAGSPPVTSPILLTNVFSGGNITFTWSDGTFSLQTATNLLGPWNTIPGVITSPFMTNVTAAPAVFYRLYHP